MSKEIDLIEENKKYYEQELADMDYKWFGIKRNKTKDEQIADLEAKLAESEETINNLEQQCLICNKDKENEQLKQYLAEKDRQIEQLKKFDDLNKTFFDLFRTAFKEPNKVDDLFNTLKTMQEKQDQDKISFCIEKLEKVKELIKDMSIGIGVETYGTRIKPVEDYIDNQIEELKKGSEQNDK